MTQTQKRLDERKQGQLSITDIESAAKSGSDTTLITGTAGTSGNLSRFNDDGDIVDGGIATSDVVTPSSTDTFTNKTFDANGTGNSISNIDVADLANGTDGELITWDDTGAPATVAAGTSGQVLTSNGAGAAPTFQDAGGGGGLTWGDSITDTSGTGVTITIANSADAGTIGQSIVIGDTQTQALTAVDINTGTSTTAQNKGINISFLSGGNGGYSGALSINNFSTATQAVAQNVYGFRYGNNFNTNSDKRTYFGKIELENNASTGTNVGLIINNFSTKAFVNSDLSNTGLRLVQSGAGGTVFSVSGGENVNSSTNGLVNYTLNNTQSGASVMQKIDLSTSAQGHTGLLVNAKGASTSQRGIHVDLGSTGHGTAIEISGSDTAGGARAFNFDDNLTQASGTATGTTTKELRITVDGTDYVIDLKSQA